MMSDHSGADPAWPVGGSQHERAAGRGDRINTTQAERTPLLVDCDPGLDDAVAILALASTGQTQFTVTDVVACEGNAPLTRTYANATFIVRESGLDAAVHAGLPLPDASRRATSPRMHGSDGLGGLGPPDQPVPASNGGAVIAAFARAHAGLATVLCTGPLTDLAAALSVEPELGRMLARVVVMAGGVDGRVELNWSANTAAAVAVCNAGLALEVVPIDVTEQVSFEPDEVAAAPLAAELLRRRAAVQGARRALVHDAVAAAVLLQPEVATFDTTGLCIAGAPVPVACRIDSRATHDLIVDLLRPTR
jgi:inosine-uridine nucleoside N-ribohydrolase